MKQSLLQRGGTWQPKIRLGHSRLSCGLANNPWDLLISRHRKSVGILDELSSSVIMKVICSPKGDATSLHV